MSVNFLSNLPFYLQHNMRYRGLRCPVQRNAYYGKLDRAADEGKIMLLGNKVRKLLRFLQFTSDRLKI